MKSGFWKFLLVIGLLLPMHTVFAQDSAPTTTPEPVILPSSYRLTGFTYVPQGWNNCGPATLTMALSYYGYTDDQFRAANWLKPNYEDKNVSPWQIEEFVNTQIPEHDILAMVRYGGTIDRLKTLIYSGFPVMIEAGYDPESANQGWMGHYLLVIGWDDAQGVIYTYDSYDGQDGNPLPYSYAHIQEYWQHFGYIYIPVYARASEALLNSVLGADSDPRQNFINAFYSAQAEATANGENAFAWFNMGAMLTELEMYNDAAVAFDQARQIGLPWRMLWYQFWPYEAYNAVGRYQDTLDLANEIRENSRGYVEETFYYAGIARAGLGERDRAIANFNEVISFNPNFTDARIRRDALLAGS